MITTIRNRLEAPSLEIVLAKLSEGAGIPFGTMIRAAQDQVAASLPGVHTVETNGLSYFNASVHYDLVGRFALAELLLNAISIPALHTAAGYASITAGRTITAGPLEGRLKGGMDADIITGNLRNNYIDAGYGENSVDGGGGNDVLTAGFNNDTLHGGAGSDLIHGSQRHERVLSPYTPGVVWDLDHDQLHGDAGNDTLYGGIGDDMLDGGTDNDLLLGEIGADTLIGGSGIDDMRGGLGNDTYFVDNSRDSVTENWGEGYDTLVTSVSYRLALGQEVESLRAAVGAGGLALTGNELANAIQGSAGADTLNGGLGADTLAGNGGSDVYLIDNVHDVVLEQAGDGADIVITSVDYALTAGQELEQLRTTTSAGLRLSGNTGTNTIIGGTGADTLAGGGGPDRLQGGSGDDVYLIDDAQVSVAELADGGVDTVRAWVSYTAPRNVENIVLLGSDALNATGNAEANCLTGNAAANNLVGGAGDDTLTGGLGRDTLFGSAGADVFLYSLLQESPAGAGRDLIYDMNVGLDRIDLSAVQAVAGAADDQGFSFLGAGGFTRHAGELRAVQVQGNTLIEADTNGDGRADLQLVLVGALSLSASDFML